MNCSDDLIAILGFVLGVFLLALIIIAVLLFPSPADDWYDDF